MTRSPTFDLLSRGRAAAMAGEKAEARRYLERLLYLDPPLEERLEALYWLSEALEDPHEQRACLEEILAHNFGDARARRRLAILDGKLRPEEIVNPDQIQAPTPGDPQTARTRSFTCPQCGARMVYAPDGQTLICEFCETRKRVAAGQTAPEDDFLIAMVTARAHHRPTTAHLVTCQGCSASFILPPQTLTQTCPYCLTPYAIEQVEERPFDAPDGILPFTLNATAARQALHAWLAGDPPRGKVRVSHPTGMYLPVWLFNMGGQVSWKGSLYQNKQRIPVSGMRVISRANLLVPASHHLPEALLPALHGFNLDNLQPYEAGFLAGFPAETFTITAANASLEARRLALEAETREIQHTELDQPAYDFSVSTGNMLVESYRLALLPLWLAFYDVDGRRYDVAINGQTGAVTGERPGKNLLERISQWF
ncbi:MAG TPA: hypothetical protein DEQ80_11705 [Anaerolinea thermolimosa]|uniref:Uncharacterized protein n=1 Tax=Anaerolinea thermolimosa TaxID=229919 RepID=A0A3D1JJV3_9CHLR|nr:hypothetical protein [Anaerolinea thermolimosa]GAP07991.1 replication restart DNA helicase PriA [Anaerolinea thermolimosa]HCE18515.1 hypothetical protein [Anaerolinea thermolimosa]